jgi:hypothetical protein
MLWLASSPISSWRSPSQRVLQTDRSQSIVSPWGEGGSSLGPLSPKVKCHAFRITRKDALLLSRRSRMTAD